MVAGPVRRTPSHLRFDGGSARGSAADPPRMPIAPLVSRVRCFVAARLIASVAASPDRQPRTAIRDRAMQTVTLSDATSVGQCRISQAVTGVRRRCASGSANAVTAAIAISGSA